MRSTALLTFCENFLEIFPQIWSSSEITFFKQFPELQQNFSQDFTKLKFCTTLQLLWLCFTNLFKFCLHFLLVFKKFKFLIFSRKFCICFPNFPEAFLNHYKGYKPATFFSFVDQTMDMHEKLVSSNWQHLICPVPSRNIA